MTHILQELSFYLSYPFVRYALIVGVLIALCSSLLGVTLVLKRFSFIGRRWSFSCCLWCNGGCYNF